MVEVGVGGVETPIRDHAPRVVRIILGRSPINTVESTMTITIKVTKSTLHLVLRGYKDLTRCVTGGNTLQALLLCLG